ncbi:MAG: hypothetical protein ABI353_15500, partial [Isosphaeraceae bacterium]
MNDAIHPGRPGRSATFLLSISLFLASCSTLRAAKVETWRHDTPSSFARAKAERVVVSDAGRVRLGREVAPLAAGLDAAHVWDLLQLETGVVYAATGDAGKVFRREGQGGWSVAFDADDTQVFSLAALPDGRVFAGTGPSGQVVDLTDPKHPASRPDPDVQYIWDLAADHDGNLYAATGPTGQLWKRANDGQWSLVLDGKHAHLLCVIVGPDGEVYAGSDGEGLIYRVAKDGKVSVLYDAPQSEVRALLFAPDGALYAGTAGESGSGSNSSPSRGVSRLDDETEPEPPPSPPTVAAPIIDSPPPDAPDDFDFPPDSTVAVPTNSPLPQFVLDYFDLPPGSTVATLINDPLPKAKDQGSKTDAPSGGTAAPKPPKPGDNAIYRISPDGAAREVFRAKTMIFALAWLDGRLLAGTGPEGTLVEVRDSGRESAEIARLDHGQILALQTDKAGDLLIGAGDPGGVLRLSPGHVVSGTLTSEVLDAKLISRFGALSWRAETPERTKVAVQVRTGNVGEPDTTWSPWSAPRTDPDPGSAKVPPGRFAQYRATLTTDDPAASPELRALTLHYQTANLPPEITKITVPDVSEADGATRQTKLSLKWDASDPNKDDLSYTLHLRKDGWPDWVRLGTDPLTSSTFSWDASAVPGGTYRLRVSASDRPSNAPDESLVSTLVSESFVVDHQAPTVTLSQKGLTLTVTLQDDLTRLVNAAYV